MLLGQAAACRLPVVATTNTGAEDMVTNSVEDFAVPTRSPEGTGGKVLYLYEKSDMRDDISRLPLRRVQGSNGWDFKSVSEATVFANALSQRQGAAGQQSSKIIVEQCG